MGIFKRKNEDNNLNDKSAKELEIVPKADDSTALEHEKLIQEKILLDKENFVKEYKAQDVLYGQNNYYRKKLNIQSIEEDNNNSVDTVKDITEMNSSTHSDEFLNQTTTNNTNTTISNQSPAISEKTQQEIDEELEYQKHIAREKAKIYRERESKIENNIKIKNNKETQKNNEKFHQNANSNIDFDNKIPKKNFITVFSDLYDQKIKDKYIQQIRPEISNKISPSELTQEDFNNINFSTIKNQLQADGFNFKTYVKKDTTSYYVNQYYKINKLLLDTILLMFFVVIIEGLLSYFVGRLFFKLTWWKFVAIFGSFLVFPVGAIINYITFPNRKVRFKIGLKDSLFYTLLLMLNSILVIALLAFFTFDVTWTNKESIIKYLIFPILLTLNFPATSFVLHLFGYSKRYYIR